MKHIARITFSFLAISVLGCAQPPAEEAVVESPAVEAAPPVAPAVAVATLAGREGLALTGTVSFIERNGGVAIAAHVEGGPAGTHGFHVHEVGDCSAADFTSAGGHFNPTGVPHGGPDDAERHAGDLGNIEIGESGQGHLELESDLLTVGPGPNSVVGLAVILHENVDDLVSQPTGAAGARLACGVVVLGG